MRPVLHGDVSCAARALLRVPAWARRTLCRKLITEAEAADVFVRQHRRLHPLWGNGSLMAAARKRVLAIEPDFDDLDYCQCFETVLQELIENRVSQRHS